MNLKLNIQMNIKKTQQVQNSSGNICNLNVKIYYNVIIFCVLFSNQ